jgi:hypothetical protein
MNLLQFQELQVGGRIRYTVISRFFFNKWRYREVSIHSSVYDNGYALLHKVTGTVRSRFTICTCYCSLTLNLIKSPCQMPIKNYFGHITYISHVLLLYLFKQILPKTYPFSIFKLLLNIFILKFDKDKQ